MDRRNPIPITCKQCHQKAALAEAFPHGGNIAYTESWSELPEIYGREPQKLPQLNSTEDCDVVDVDACLSPITTFSRQ